MLDRKSIVFCFLIIINLTAILIIGFSKSQQCPEQVKPIQPITIPVPMPAIVNSNNNDALTKYNEVDRLNLWRSQGAQDKYTFQNIFWSMAEPGIFVEFGARNGEEHSNSYFYEHALHWRGVLVEVNPGEIEGIKARRPNSLVLQGGLCDKQGMLEFSLTGGSTGISAQTEHLIDRFPQFQKDIKKVPCYTLNDVLTTAGITKVDYMTVDTEGSEFPILNALDWNKFVINIVQIETIGAEKDKRAKIDNLMVSRGYKLIKEIDLGYDTVDVIYQRTAAADLLKYDKVLKDGWPKEFDPSTWKK